MARTKEEKAQRKEGKVKEWLGVFCRSYEIARAYGAGIEKSVHRAVEDTNEYMRKDWVSVPQDRMFFVDCRMEMEKRIKGAVVAVEKGEAPVWDCCDCQFCRQQRGFDAVYYPEKAERNIMKDDNWNGWSYRMATGYEPETHQNWVAKIILALFVLIVVGLLCVGFASADTNIVSIARSQIGLGEIGGDNKGSVVRQYTKGSEVAWCAGYVSWVMKKAGYMDGRYYLRARDFWEKEHHVKNPRAGDVIVFSRGKNPRLGHVGIVESVKDGVITTIEGNTGEYPSKVKRITYRKTPKNLLGFVRLNGRKQ